MALNDKLAENRGTVISLLAAAFIALAVEMIPGGTYSLPVMVISVILILSVTIPLLPTPTKHIGRGKYFSGVARLGPGDKAWPRSEASQILGAIKKRTRTASLLCGPSGAGKSTLVRCQVLPELESDGWVIFAPDDLSTLRAYVVAQFHETFRIPLNDLNALSFDHSALARNQKSLLVLDQAEQLLNASADDIRWIANLLSKCSESNNTKLLICVRPDYYLPLKNVFGPLVPNPDGVCWLSGFDLSGSDSAIRANLRQVVSESSVATKIIDDLASKDLVRIQGSGSLIKTRGSVLPLELQMVGRVLELEKSRGRSIDLKLYAQRLHGARGAVHRYFAEFLSASSSYDVSLAVLCALSATTPRSSLHLDDLAAISCYSPSEIRLALNAFEDEGLLVEVRADEYEWVHDYLATAFREFSATVMNPIRRDNILFLSERRLRNAGSATGVFRSDEVIGKANIARVFFAMVLLVVVVRITLALPLDGISIRVPMVSMDTMYAAFGLAHLAWAFFVYKFMCLFIRLRTGARVFPWVLGAIGVVVVVVGALWPMLWLISIGVIALLLALKFFHIACHWSLPPQARRMTAGFGWNCLVMECLAGGGGWWFAEFWISKGATTSQLERQDVADGLAFFVFLVAVMAIVRHATHEGVARWLGVLDRSYGTTVRSTAGEESSNEW